MITEKDLEEGEYVCHKCKGERYIDIINPEGFSEKDRCDVHGKVDWVTNICGRYLQHTMISPGVYVKEIDVSTVASKSKKTIIIPPKESRMVSGKLLLNKTDEYLEVMR